jgi:hypothetical protein
MDRKELIIALQPFKQQCETEGYTLGDMVLEEAYPGVIPTSFIVKVVAKGWLRQISCSDALHRLLKILWATTEAKIRENIFTVAIYDEQESLHCWDEETDTQILKAL